MKFTRTVKNIIMIVMIIALGTGAYFTMDYAAQQSQQTSFSQSFKGEMGGMGEMQNDFKKDKKSSDATENAESTNGTEAQNGAEAIENFGKENSGERPEMPSGEAQSGDSSQQMPEMPGGENAQQGSNADSQQPPEMPSGEAPSGEMPSGETNSSDSAQQNAEAPDISQNSGGQQAMPEFDKSAMKTESKGTDAFLYALFGAESLEIAALAVYLILSGFNKRSLNETLGKAKNLSIYVLSVLIITGGLTFGEAQLSEKVFASSGSQTQQEQMTQGGTGTSTTVDASGATVVDGEEKTLDGDYTSTESDESPVLVKNGGNATIKGAKINKSSGDSSNTENSEFYGVNSGVLVQEGSTATISDAEITTSAKGANAVFATGTDAKIYISNSKITTTGSSSSRGLDATYGGYIEADNVTITTQGGSCATLATDRGEGTVIAKNSTLETNGAGSPVIYSTGNISIDNTTGTANGSQMVVIEGKNSATVTNSTLTASGKGNRNEVDNAGVMIYQSMSGDAGEGTGTFTATDSSLSIQSDSDYYKTAPMFFITNTDAIINLTNTKLTFGSGVLISAMGTDEWGNSGSNGGNVTLNADSQTLTGNVVADSISSVSLNLTSSTYEGTITGAHSAKEVTLKLDKGSTVKLTGDSYVTSLDDEDTTYSNIDFNGYTLYVNGKAVN